MTDPSRPAGASPRLDVLAIKARYEKPRYVLEDGTPVLREGARDVLVLLAENERLRAERDRLEKLAMSRAQDIVQLEHEDEALRLSLAGIRETVTLKGTDWQQRAEAWRQSKGQRVRELRGHEVLNNCGFALLEIAAELAHLEQE
jgi:hypothetical protein